MTSKPIDITLSLQPENETPEIIEGKGEYLYRDGKTLLRLQDLRIQIEKDRLLIRRGYVLTLDPNKTTALEYPTPYGTLSMEVKTKKLVFSPGGNHICADYALYTNQKYIHTIHLSLTLSEE